MERTYIMEREECVYCTLCTVLLLLLHMGPPKKEEKGGISILRTPS